MEDAVPPLCLEIMEFSPRPGCNKGSQPRFPGCFCFSLLTCWEGQPTLPIFERCHENFFIAWRYLRDFGCAEVISPRQKTLLIMRLVCIIHHFSHIEVGLIGGNLCLLYLWLMVSILAVTLHETNIAPELLGLED